MKKQTLKNMKKQSKYNQMVKSGSDNKEKYNRIPIELGPVQLGCIKYFPLVSN